MINSNDSRYLPDPSKSRILVSENIGDLFIQVYRTMEADVVMEATTKGELVRFSKYQGITDFEAGRLYQAEIDAYKKIIK